MMRARPTATRRGWRVLLPLVLIACVSCASLQPVPVTDVHEHDLVGRWVRVATTDGRTIDFQVLAVTEDSLEGESQRVRLDEIATLELRQIDVSGFAQVAAVAAAVLAVLVALTYESAG